MMTSTGVTTKNSYEKVRNPLRVINTHLFKNRDRKTAGRRRFPEMEKSIFPKFEFENKTVLSKN